MQRKKKTVRVSAGNVRDLILPFLYQTKTLKESEEVDRFSITLDNDNLSYIISLTLKRGGVKNKELSEGDNVGGHKGSGIAKRGPKPGKAEGLTRRKGA